MIRGSWSWMAMGWVMAAVGCSSGGGGGGFVDGGAGSGAVSGQGGSGAMGGGGTGATAGSGGAPPQCKPGGESCVAFNECCSGACAQQICTGCTMLGQSCGSSDECCAGLLCVSGQCSACKATGDGCTLSTDCCSNICNQGSCASCSSDGTSCTGPTECCSGQCNAGICGTGTSGACVNPGDENAKAGQDLQQAAFVCYLQCGSAPGQCVTDCMTGNGLSSGCANCYGQGVQCVFDNCYDPCLTSLSSPECVSCRAQYCDAPFKACSGWATP